MIIKTLPSEDELVELVKDKVLVSHAITMASEEYIKKSTTDFVFQHLLYHCNIIDVENSAENLKKSMLASSLTKDDLALLLHGCVSRKHGLHVDPKKSEKKEDLASEQQVLDTLQSQIDIIKNNKGSLRVNRTETSFGTSLPVKLNLEALVFDGDSKIDEVKFLGDLLELDAGLTMYLEIPLSILDHVISDVIKLSDALGEKALELANESNLNKAKTEIIENPWEAFCKLW